MQFCYVSSDKWRENAWFCYQISTLPILSVEDEATLNDDEECSARQIVRHVCVALKRYLEAHLCIKAENLRRTQFRETGGQLEPVLPPAKVSTEHFLCMMLLWEVTMHNHSPIYLVKFVYLNLLISGHLFATTSGFMWCWPIYSVWEKYKILQDL